MPRQSPFLRPGSGRVVMRIENWDRINYVIRDQQGRFTKARGAVIRAHMQMAQHVAAEQYRILSAAVRDRATRWPDSHRSTRHLRRAVQAQGNSRPLEGDWARGYEVGIPEHFDSTPAAPYWRQVEAGTSVFQGRMLLAVGLMDAGHTGTGLRDITNMPGVRGPRVRVERRIEGHRFLSQGAAQAGARLRKGLRRRIYELELEGVGIRISDDWNL